MSYAAIAREKAEIVERTGLLGEGDAGRQVVARFFLQGFATPEQRERWLPRIAFCLALLQEPSVERVKPVLRSELGAVMGSSKAACVKTLRRKLDELSQQRQAVRLGTLLARRWLEVGLVNANYLYVDSHPWNARQQVNDLREVPAQGVRLVDRGGTAAVYQVTRC